MLIVGLHVCWVTFISLLLTNIIHGYSRYENNMLKELLRRMRARRFQVLNIPIYSEYYPKTEKILGIPKYPEELPRAENMHPAHTLMQPAFGMLKSAVKFPMRSVRGHELRSFHRTGPKNLKGIGATSIPQFPEELPAAEPVHPGHTLLKPTLDTLKSAAKYPQKDSGTLVYGNLNNLGLAYGNTQDRILYTDFRKHNQEYNNDFANIFVTQLRKVLQNNRKPSLKKKIQSSPDNFSKRPVIIVVKKHMPSAISNEDQTGLNEYLEVPQQNLRRELSEESTESENNAEEINEDTEHTIDGRRSRNRISPMSSEMSAEDESIAKNRKFVSSSSSSSSSSDEDNYDRNPGNPFTVSKNRYKQNWMWNFGMTGDHMNVNPHAPEFMSKVPTGADLFFGRKWWYFNQDDYLPFR